MKKKFEDVLLLCAALVAWTLFSLYRRLATWLVPGLLVLLVYFWCDLNLLTQWFVIIAAISAIVWAPWQLYVYGRDRLPESVGAGGIRLRICSRFITWIGTLKYYKKPWVIVEETATYQVQGKDIRELTGGDAAGVLQPGDIILRGFDGYVDGEFIRRTGGATGSGQLFSHAALYVGRIQEADRAIACRRLKVVGEDGEWRDATPAEQDAMRNNPAYFQTGPQMVIHSMAKGAFVEDILTFLRCDHVAVLRPPPEFRLQDARPGARPLVTLTGEAEELDRRLQNGETLLLAEVFAAARNSALGQIGAGYDCLFEDCKTFQRFSCSELVYYCYKSVHRVLGLAPQTHAIAGLFKRTTVSPADLYAAATMSHIPGKLKIVWQNVPPATSPIVV